MAFARFSKVAVKEVVEKGPRDPWVTVEQNGASGYIMHLNAATLDEFSLAENDTIELGFDPDTRQVGFKKSKTGEFRLVRHGNNPRRLKVSITAFYRAELEQYGLELPFKATPEKTEGWIAFPFRRRKPRSDRGLERGAYGPRKVVEASPVVTKKLGRPFGSKNKSAQSVA